MMRALHQTTWLAGVLSGISILLIVALFTLYLTGVSNRTDAAKQTARYARQSAAYAKQTAGAAKRASYNTCLSQRDTRLLLDNLFTFLEERVRQNPGLTTNQRLDSIQLYEYLRRTYLRRQRCVKP